MAVLAMNPVVAMLAAAAAAAAEEVKIGAGMEGVVVASVMRKGLSSAETKCVCG